MQSLRVEARFKNNILWHAIYDTHESVTAWAEANMVSESLVCSYINLRESPYGYGSSGRKTSKTPKTLRPKPAAKRIAAALGMAVEDVFPAYLYEHRFETLINEIDGAHMLPLLAARKVSYEMPGPADQLHISDRTEAVNSALKTLTAREEQVIRLRFGMDGEEVVLEDVGRILGVSRERIRQIEAKALRKLRHLSRSRALIPYLEGSVV